MLVTPAHVPAIFTTLPVVAESTASRTALASALEKSVVLSPVYSAKHVDSTAACAGAAGDHPGTSQLNSIDRAAIQRNPAFPIFPCVVVGSLFIVPVYLYLGNAQNPIDETRETRHRPPPSGAGDGVFRGYQLGFAHSPAFQYHRFRQFWRCRDLIAIF
jgi:hypothetical protein